MTDKPKSGSKSVIMNKSEKKTDDPDDIPKHIPVKVGMIGESQAGKTSLMVKYVDDKFGEDYLETMGVNFMEKTVKLRNLMVTISVYDIGGQKQYMSMMPLVCSDAKFILFVFDLTRKQSLSMIKEWYSHARKLNKFARALLVGCKFDLFIKKSSRFREEITAQARKFAKAMKAPLIYSSSSHSINIKSIFQLILGNLLNLRLRVPEVSKVSEPILEYKAVWARKRSHRGTDRERERRKEKASARTRRT